MKCFHWADFSYNDFNLYLHYYNFYFCRFKLVSLRSYIVTLILTLNKFHKQTNSSCSKISQNPIGKPAVNFCFSCRALNFIFIELCNMLSLEFGSSYFSKYLRLIAITKSSFFFIKKAVLKHFAIFTGKQLCCSLFLIKVLF